MRPRLCDVQAANGGEGEEVQDEEDEDMVEEEDQ
jgi:hypothetical protein